MTKESVLNERRGRRSEDMEVCKKDYSSIWASIVSAVLAAMLSGAVWFGTARTTMARTCEDVRNLQSLQTEQSKDITDVKIMCAKTETQYNDIINRLDRMQGYRK